METEPAADGTRGQGATVEGTTLHLEMTAERAARKTIFGENETAWLIGVRAANSVDMQPKGFWEAASAGATETGRMVSLTWLSFVKLAERVVPLDQVGGPIMIARWWANRCTRVCRACWRSRPYQHQPGHPEPAAHSHPGRRPGGLLPAGNHLPATREPQSAGICHARGPGPAHRPDAAGHLQRRLASDQVRRGRRLNGRPP